MALLFCDSFNHVDDVYQNAKWSIFQDDWVTYGAGLGRRGEWGMVLYGFPNYTRKNLTANYGTLIFGAAFKLEEYNAGYSILRFYDGNNIQIEVRPEADGSFKVLRSNSTVLGSSDPGVIAIDVWFYLEAKIVFHNTTGSVELKVNGVQVLNLTGQDTSLTGNEYANGFGAHSNFGEVWIDDLYLCDTSGGVNDDFLGDIKITPLYPTSDGNSSDFTRSAGANNYENVDEPQMVNETDYNYSSTVNHKDLYGVTNFTATGTIFGVQVVNIINNLDAGSMNVRALSRSGGTPVDNEGSDKSISTTVTAASYIWDQEPTDTVAWTDAKINAAEFGIKVQS